MLERVKAAKFGRPMRAGKTFPSLLTIVDSNGIEIEVIAKMSGRCELGVGSLAAEMIASLLATDLNLPIPRPYLVELSPNFINAIANDEVRELAVQSSPLCFATRRLPDGAHSWVAGTPVSDQMLEIAASIFAFDVLIENVDRRAENTNLLTTGTDIWVYDHDLAFPPLLIGVKPPWVPGSCEDLRRPGLHVLYPELKGKPINLATFCLKWSKISDGRLHEYRHCLPAEWFDGQGVSERAIARIRNVRDNIEACMIEVTRVLQ